MSNPGAVLLTPADHSVLHGPLADLAWQAFLRRFDIEHFFRMIKQNLGWTAPKLRDPEAGDNWTWLVVAAYTQLRLARPLTTDLRRPWERPLHPNKLTPARVRRGFRHLRAKISTPARVPKPSRPGPGRPPGSKNRRPAERYDVGLLLVGGDLVGLFVRPAPARQPGVGHQAPGTSSVHLPRGFVCRVSSGVLYAVYA